MRWEDERYVRLYTRDTMTWLMLGWEGQAVFALLMRKVDRAGIFDLSGYDEATALGAVLQMPAEIIATGMAKLVKQRVIERGDGCLIVANFIEAQEASMSPTMRQKESRQRRRDHVRSGLDMSQKATAIYFIQSENGGSIKIGKAEDLAKRLVNLQTARPDKLVVLAAFPGTADTERLLHERFAHLREKGEWFLPGEDLMAYVREKGAANQDPVTDRDASQLVTGHETHAVTLSHAVLSHAVPSEIQKPNTSFALALIPPTPPTAPAAVPSDLPLLAVVAPVGPVPEREVFEHWLAGWRRVVGGTRPPAFAGKRKAKVIARLEEGFTVEELKRAIDGMWSSAFHVDGGFTDLELVCRDDGKVHAFLARTSRSSGVRTVADVAEPDPELTDEEQEAMTASGLDGLAVIDGRLAERLS